MEPGTRRHKTAFLLLFAAFALSCGRSTEHFEFLEASHDVARYDFDFVLDDADAMYDSWIALRYTEVPSPEDSVFIKLTLVSPSGVMAQEILELPSGTEHTVGKDTEYQYRRGIRVAQDTGLWHLSAVPAHPCVRKGFSGSNEPVGMGFRYRKRK